LLIDFFAENVLAEHQVAPLILINFVENAFKHTHWETHPDAWINVHLEMTDDNELIFEVSNCKYEVKKVVTRHHGIGLTNTKKQLELNYPNRHTLTIVEETDSYNILLKINLNRANT
jgi:two-component system, LytTR family, sensor kinase